MEHAPGDNQSGSNAPASDQSNLEPDPVAHFNRASSDLILWKCLDAFAVSHHPAYLIDFLIEWTQARPNEPLPQELVRELPRLRRGIKAPSAAIQQKVERVLKMKALRSIGQPIGRKTARSFAQDRAGKAGRKPTAKDIETELSAIKRLKKREKGA